MAVRQRLQGRERCIVNERAWEKNPKFKAISFLGCVYTYTDIRMSEIRISSERLHVSDRNVFRVYMSQDIQDALYVAYV